MYWNDLNSRLKAEYGCKVYKLALSSECSCPNRDGTLDTRGCIFCDGAEAGAIPDQLAAARLRVAAKAGTDAKYIAYFQSFTNTYGDADRLRALYQAAMAPEDVVILSIATRPDCLGPDILGLLEELNRIKPVWVELGLQTIHPESARYLRRGYDLPVFDRAVKDLKAIGVTVIVHQILGLPGETPEMMAETARYIGQSGAEGIKFHLLHVLRNTDLAAETARYIGQSGAEGIKFHLLHVLRNTDLAAEWQAGRVQTLELEEYISILELCLRNLPPEAVIHRLTGDGAKRDLLAPLWSGDKKRVLNAIHQAFLRDNLIQGSTL